LGRIGNSRTVRRNEAPDNSFQEEQMTDEPLSDDEIETTDTGGSGPAGDADGTDGGDADGTDGGDGDSTDTADGDGTDGGDADGTDGGDADGTDGTGG
jgi:hypothetical protein